jgi:hypothetical protein
MIVDTALHEDPGWMSVFLRKLLAVVMADSAAICIKRLRNRSERMREP